MSDETSKQQDPQDGVKIRKKTQDAGAATAEEQGVDAAYSAKAEEQIGRARVAYAEGFEPPTSASVSTAAAAPAQGSSSSPEDVTAQAVPEASAVTTDDFAAMFEAEAGAKTTPGRNKLSVGDRISGMVQHIDTQSIFVELGQRVEGRAARGQFTDKDGELEVELGKTYEFYVLDVRGDSVELGKHLDQRGAGIFALEQAAESQVPVQGKVTARNKGGFEVEVLGTSTFCPVSHIDLHNAEDLDVYVDQTFEFVVLEVRDGGRSVVVSRRALLQQQQDAEREKLLEKLEVGALLTGTVRSLLDFGAFVELGGVDGLVHISELSWGAVEKVSDVLAEGQEITVKVISVEGQGRKMRVGLSLKQAQDNPWDLVQERYAVGQELEGTVVRTAQYGAFVELEPGIDGLVHVSELSWGRVTRPTDVVAVGDTVRVRIQGIDLARQRISLSMREAKADPWDNVEERFPLGQEVEGAIQKVEDFGAFIELGQGITALLPRSEMGLSRQDTPQSRYRKGHTVKARVLTIDKERRRMALTVREGDVEELAEQAAQAAPARQERAQGGNNGGGGKKRQDRRQGKQEQGGGDKKSSGSESFGTFADLLRNK